MVLPNRRVSVTLFEEHAPAKRLSMFLPIFAAVDLKYEDLVIQYEHPLSENINFLFPINILVMDVKLGRVTIHWCLSAAFYLILMSFQIRLDNHLLHLLFFGLHWFHFFLHMHQEFRLNEYSWELIDLIVSQVRVTVLRRLLWQRARLLYKVQRLLLR